MYKLFKNSNKGDAKVYHTPNVPITRSNLQRDLTRIISFYRKQKGRVKESHLISQLIEMLSISYKRDEFSTISACMDRAKEVSILLGLVHPYNISPKQHNGVFYNDKVVEIIVIDDSAIIDINFVRRHWYNLNCFNIVCHPFNDISFDVQYGNYQGSGSGYAVIYLNLPLLLLMFKYWCNEELRRDRNVLLPELFIHQVVIPNMLFNHANIALMNRTMDIYRGRSVPDYYRVHPVHLADHNELVEKAISDILRPMESDQTIHPDNFFKSKPTLVTGSTWNSVLTPPDIPPNKNVRWALNLGVLKYVDFWLEYYVKSGTRQNLRKYVYPMLKQIKAMENNKETRNYLNLGGFDYYQNIKNNLVKHRLI